MNKIILYIALLCFPVLVCGQGIRLDSLWKQADQGLLVQQNRLDLAAKQEQQAILRMDRMPLVYGDVNLQRNIIIPSTPVPAIAFDPNAQEGAILPLKFATKWNSKAGVQLEWKLYDPNRREDRRKAELEVQKAGLAGKKAQDDWKKEITLAYTSCILASEQYQLALADSSSYASILQVIQDRVNAGRESTSTLLQAQQEMQRRIIQRHEAWAVLLEADLDLRKLSPMSNYRYLSSSLADIQKLIEQELFANYSLEQLEIDQKIALGEIQQIRSQRLPTLSMNGFFGAQFFSNDFQVLERNNWYGNSFVNLGIKIPISAYFSQQPNIRKAQLQDQLALLKIKTESLEDQTNQKQLEVKVWSAKQKLEGLEKIEALAQQDQENQYQVWKEGRILLSEYLQAERTLLAAKKERWQANFDLIQTLLDK